jgi:excisionase family DNA binding protein
METTYTATQAAQILGVTDRMVRKLIEKGRFPNAYRVDPFNPNSPYRIPKQDVERFQQARVLAAK